ncbi:MAG TPA: hypothetical protein VLT47_00970 [Anaeromyxobacteraceae bacterium]|nr:hypothetical protein [Anaeromyxobacteraceae bacterium]
MKRLAILGAALLGGCASFSTMSTARTTPRDTTQVWLAPEIAGLTFDTGTPPDRQAITLPQLEFGVRRGITDDLEVGAKVWLLGAAMEGKLQVLRAPTQDGGVDVAIAPSIGWLGFNTGDGGSFNVVTGYLSVPVGVNVPGGSQLVLTPKAIYQQYLSSGGGESGSASLLFLGGSVGYAWKVGTMYVLPELSMMRPVINPATSDVIKYDGVVFQGGLGFLFGT